MTSTVHAAPRRAAASASAAPVIVGVGAVVVSLIIAIVVAVGLSAPVKLFLAVAPPLVVADFWWVSLIGYLLTPVVVIGCYGWDAIAQRNGMRQDANFRQRTEFGQVLRWAVGVSIMIGAWHTLNLSVPLTEMWGLS